MDTPFIDIFGLYCSKCHELQEACYCEEKEEWLRWKARIDADWEVMSRKYFELTGEHLLDPAKKVLEN